MSASDEDRVALTARQYDDVPYGSFPFALLDPARTGAVASLYGFAPADPASARILEIGCASGGHIIPLAARLPGATFLGIDVSGVQIASGKSRIANAGLTNISLAEQSITDLNEADGPFDYIICHGVFSWVSEPVRKAILEKSSQLLSSRGIATVSFNVLPGWRLLQVIRDTAIEHARRFSTPSEKAFEMRSLFNALSQYTNGETTYGSIWRNEVKRLTAQPDYYLHHELLESDNAPMTITTFQEAAAQHGLNYIGDANLMSGIPANAGAERSSLIHVLAQNQFLAHEQYTDLVSGRTFRHAILVKGFQRTEVDLFPHLPRIDTLHLIPPPGLKLDSLPDGTWSVVDNKGLDIQTADIEIAEAIRLLISNAPSTSQVSDLFPRGANEQAMAKITEAIRSLVTMGMINVTLLPLACPKWPVQHPKAWFLALADIKAGLEHTATRFHTAFRIDEPTRRLLPLADGQSSIEEIVAAFSGFVADGEVKFTENEQPVTDPVRLSEMVGAAVDSAMAGFARSGLLVS